ncbi:hypothetical protein JWZ98_18595 [Methylomonas sp. EFPC1]|uniref:hypothetical protein n=1 Tax=Methylomonas sp. EFPC1 TaxID=2812647 RepID=UPI001967417E|nr:hypothetical protein [Methylomonas sp. EFPC1]QSB00646.1 hypothetical protein JWZ98_18595 [Methylomonas sp. EFPC1]
MFRNVLIIAAAAATALAAYSLYVMQSAKSSAEETASTFPYCIQIATGGSEYKSIRGLIELAGLYMRSNGTINHAVLVIGNPDQPVLYHWSYMENQFIEGAFGEPPIYCEPARHFLRKVGLYGAPGAAGSNFRFRGYQFSIPSEYAPLVSFTSPAHIAIAALSPTFAPQKSYQCGEAPCNYVGITIGFDGKLEGWLDKASRVNQIEALGQHKGLIKERILSRSSHSPRIQYYRLGPDGRVNTLVHCFEGSEFQCTHLFTDGEFSYYFHHMSADPDSWSDLQQSLITTVSKFIVGRPAQRAVRADHRENAAPG